MFELQNKYDCETQGLIKDIETKELGNQVIKARRLSIPIQCYEIELGITKVKKFNLIEEFILKIALANLGYQVTEEVIQSMLGLDQVFTSSYVNKLLDVQALDKSKLPTLKVTELGMAQFTKGQVLTTDTPKKITAYIQPQLKLLYSDIIGPMTQYEHFDLEEEPLTPLHIEGDKEIMNQIVNIAKENKIIVNKDTVNQYLNKINSVKSKGTMKILNCIELWLYDIAEEKLSCRVWDCARKSYVTKISDYIKQNKPISKNDFEQETYHMSTQKIYVHKYEEIFKREIRELRKETKELGNKEDNSYLSLRMLRGIEIKNEFNECLNNAKTYLYIQSPWISKQVVDESMIKLFKKLAKNDVKIFISWGIAHHIDQEDRKPSVQLIETLRNIKLPNGMPSVYIYWIGNHHNKEVIVDDTKHLAGSFNWLSYRGDYLPRGESVYVTNDKKAIYEARSYWEGQMFEAIINAVWKENYIREIDALINLETMKHRAEQFLQDEIFKIFKSKDKKKFSQIYNIALVHFKNKQYNSVFLTCIEQLIKKEHFLEEVCIMINYLRKNNKVKIYESIINVYKEKFIKQKLIDDKLKLDRDLEKRSNVGKLEYILAEQEIVSAI